MTIDNNVELKAQSGIHKYRNFANACSPEPTPRPTSSTECQEKLAGTIGVTREVALEMGIIKRPEDIR